MSNSAADFAALAPLLGQWRLTSFDIEIQQTGERRPAWGSGPRGRLVVLPNGLMMVMLTAGDRPLPVSDELKAAAFSQALAYSGRVAVEGEGQLRIAIDLSLNPGWVDTVQLRDFGFVDGRLVFLSPWGAMPNDPALVCRGVLAWERED